MRITPSYAIRNVIASMPDIESGPMHSGIPIHSGSTVWEDRPRLEEKRKAPPSIPSPAIPDIESGNFHSGSNVWENRPRLKERRNAPPSVGFPSLAKQIAQDPDQETFVFRKFSRLTAWSLVFQENELASLEEELGGLEEKLFNDPNAVESATMWSHFEQKSREQSTPERHITDLTHKISGKLAQYRKLHPPPQRRNTD